MRVQKPSKRYTHAEIVRVNTNSIARLIHIIHVTDRLASRLLLQTSSRLEEALIECGQLGRVEPGGVTRGVHSEEDISFVLEEGVVPAAVYVAMEGRRRKVAGCVEECGGSVRC